MAESNEKQLFKRVTRPSGIRKKPLGSINREADNEEGQQRPLNLHGKDEDNEKVTSEETPIIDSDENAVRILQRKEICPFFKKAKTNSYQATTRRTTKSVEQQQDDDFINEGKIYAGEDAEIGMASESALQRYESERSLNIGDDSKATLTLSVDTEKDKDHRAVLERNLKVGKDILEGKLEKGIYRGQGAYAPVTNIRESSIAAGKYTGRYGPVRGSENIRSTLRIDYDPCICKDFFETGYCGFGDSCKFLHDRSDYKAGWKIEKEWEEQQKKKQDALAKFLSKHEKEEKKNEKLTRNTQDNSQADAHEDEEDKTFDSSDPGTSNSSSDDDDDENPDHARLPFACLLCRKKWNSTSRPVVTVCKHYFCEGCALQHYKQTSKCGKCSRETGGLFNEATAIVARMK